MHATRLLRRCLGFVLDRIARTPAQVAAIYARRMQIDQSFRDLKSHRYAVGFEDSLTRTRDRLAALLLILALASFVAWLIARTATRDILSAAAATLVRSTRTCVLSGHRIGWRPLLEQRGESTFF